ncbi:MAG: hypothetical protein AAGG09_22625 [Pseudomonadota bacterium]
MQDETSLSTIDCYAGIDVGKRHLDVFFLPSRQKARFPNDKTGMRDLVRLGFGAKIGFEALFSL